MSFQVGDKVKVREWDDMAAEFGVDEDGDIKCPRYFTTGMRPLCGRVATISRVMETGSFHLDSDDDNDWCWGFTADMVVPA